MAKIIDIILHKNKYSTQLFIVVDAMPEILYEKKGGFLIGECDGFFAFYKYERPSKNYQAFGGREFDIKMKDGSTIKANGQWWDSCPKEYSELNLLYAGGVGEPEELKKCNVFSSYAVDRELVDDWLENNDPSNNYYKYDESNKAAFMAHHIVSKFED